MDVAIKSQTSIKKPMVRARTSALDCIFAPRTVAVIGATDKPGSVGRAVLQNLDPSFFRVFAINPHHTEVLGIKCWPDIGSIALPIDLAVITTPAVTVPAIISQCVAAGVKGAVILSAGFKERGKAGADLEHRILALAAGKMRILGPNCLGIMAPHAGLNATFANTMALPGGVGFISQSGAFCTAILDWSLREEIGFSAFVSVGSMLDIGWGDLIDYLANDPHTRSLVIYMESVGDARSFLSAAREAALAKPIVILKVGKTGPASKAAASHTGALTGSDEVLHAAFRRVGVLRVNTIEELFDMAEVLAKQPRPSGLRLAIVTNAGGPGAVATDMLVSSGGELASLSEATFNTLNEFLPPHWSHGNPIDIIGDADAERYARTLEAVRRDPNNDGALVILTPQAMTDCAGIAERVKAFSHFEEKPLLACWMGGDSVVQGRHILNAASVCTFDYPDTAARAFYYMWRYSYNLRGIYETPAMAPLAGQTEVGGKETASIIDGARREQRTLLTEYESKRILEAYCIPTAKTQMAASKGEAAWFAEKFGYPVVLKLFSKTITHKTDVGGVQLNLRSRGDVERAWDAIKSNVSQKAGPEHFLGVMVEPMIESEGYELILGSNVDAQFGPVLLFGLGGQLVEIFQDRALGLPPLNSTLARRMMEQTRIFEALKGVRGRRPIDLAALEQLLVRFSYLVVDQPWIREIDINPLLASPDRLIALDARIVLHGPEVTAENLPKLAIRPYPTQYVMSWRLKNGLAVVIRPIRPEDEPLMVKFHETLSEQSVFHRYFTPMKLAQRITHERLTRICFNDYDRDLPLVADYCDKDTGQHAILGVGRLRKIRHVNEGDVAVVISDQVHNQGLGTELLYQLIRIARDEKLERLNAVMKSDNDQIKRICHTLGFVLCEEGSECIAEMAL